MNSTATYFFAPGLIMLAAISAGCFSSKIDKALADLPCHDGWSDRGVEGRSVLWEPTTAAIEVASVQLPADREIGCWHRYPTGRVLVLSADNQGTRWAMEFLPEGEGYVRASEYEDRIVTAK